ncbi:class I SAM-dependent methyltransferase [soil metagenome]
MPRQRFPPALFGYTKSVTFNEILQQYHELEPRAFNGRIVFAKPGVRGYPEVHPAAGLFVKAEAGGTFLDATGSAGAAALAVLGTAEAVTVLESSRAALRCAQATFKDMSAVTLGAGAVWDAPVAGADTVLLIPTTDRGNVRVAAELTGAHAALRDGGTVYAAMHKDQGAKRYEKLLASTFGAVEVIAKNGGWRLARALKRGGEAQALNLVEFEAAGMELVAEPGVYAAGKLDPGTAVLLETYDFSGVTGSSVLDLGCGYGLLALTASLAGAEVTALDDDLAAVRSTYRNARAYGLDLRLLHSDVNSELKEDEHFDIVLMNPPFHVGKGVRLELPHAFIAAAYKHLQPGGEMVLVANQALRYENLLARFAYWETLSAARGFKVLRALR